MTDRVPESQTCDRCPSTDARTVTIDGQSYRLCPGCYELVGSSLTRGGDARA